MKEAEPAAFQVSATTQSQKSGLYPPSSSSTTMTEATTPSSSPSPSDSEPSKARIPAPAKPAIRVLKSALASKRNRKPRQAQRRVRFDVPPDYEPDRQTDNITRKPTLRTPCRRSGRNRRPIRTSRIDEFFELLWTFLELYCFCWVLLCELFCISSPASPMLGL